MLAALWNHIYNTAGAGPVAKATVTQLASDATCIAECGEYAASDNFDCPVNVCCSMILICYGSNGQFEDILTSTLLVIQRPFLDAFGSILVSKEVVAVSAHVSHQEFIFYKGRLNLHDASELEASQVFPIHEATNPAGRWKANNV